jgi:hypothetical protein
MSKKFILISVWVLIAVLVIIVPFYWAIAYKRTDAGEKMDLVYQNYHANDWAIMLSGLIFGGVWLGSILVAFVATATSHNAGWIVGGIIMGMAIHLLLRLPIGAGLLVASCTASYDTTLSTTQPVLIDCTSFDKELALTGFFLDWIMLAIYIVIGLAVFTLYKMGYL